MSHKIQKYKKHLSHKIPDLSWQKKVTRVDICHTFGERKHEQFRDAISGTKTVLLNVKTYLWMKIHLATHRNDVKYAFVLPLPGLDCAALDCAGYNLQDFAYNNLHIVSVCVCTRCGCWGVRDFITRYYTISGTKSRKIINVKNIFINENTTRYWSMLFGLALSLALSLALALACAGLDCAGYNLQDFAYNTLHIVSGCGCTRCGC